VIVAVIYMDTSTDIDSEVLFVPFNITNPEAVLLTISAPPGSDSQVGGHVDLKESK
jgi:hypothetical protein